MNSHFNIFLNNLNKDKPNLIKKFDKFMFYIGIIVPLLSSSQVFKIYIEKSAEGVSLIAWGAYLISSILWTFYGILHNEKPLIATWFICFIINLLVVMGIFFYG